MHTIEFNDLNKIIRKYAIKIRLSNIILVLTILAFIVLTFVNYYLHNKAITYILLGLVGLALCCIIYSSIHNIYLKKWYYEEINNHLECKNIDAIYKYKDDDFTKKIIFDSKVFSPTYDWSGKLINIISGQYLNIRFNSFIASINDGLNDLFNGDIYQINYNRDFNLIIRKKNCDYGEIILPEYQTDNPKFNEIYEVYTDNAGKLNVLLDNSLINYILNHPAINFISLNEAFYVGLENNYKYDNFTDIIVHIEDDYINDFDVIGNILDRLS